MEPNENNDVTEDGNQTGNMYRYNGQESNSNDPQRESNAIRRSIGQGDNPYILNQNNNINNDQDQQNAIRRSLGDRNPNNADFPNYQEKSSEQRIPNLQESHSPFQINPAYNNQFQPNIVPFSRNEPKKSYYITYFVIILIQILLFFVIGFAYENNNDYEDFSYDYHFYKDVNLMIFIGFGLLYTSLKDHQWSSIVIVLFTGIFSFEISFFWNYLWKNCFDSDNKDHDWEKVKIKFEQLIRIDYFTATVLISMGALIGKISVNQILIITIFETFFSSLNYYFCYRTIKAIDNGGSLYIHTFGAIFGFIVSILGYRKDYGKILNNPHLKSDYYSNIISFIGSLFLWLYFPSFNIANIQTGKNKENKFLDIFRYRGIVNTYLSMIGSVIGTFVVSPLVSKGKLKIEHLLNASYVGGIIIGGCCTICSSAWGAILIGFIGGCLSVLGLWKLKKILREHKIDDTFGIMYTFGIPGILGGFLNSIFMGNFSNKSWGNNNNVNYISQFFNFNRSPGEQGGFQILALFTTIFIAAISGFCIGFIISHMNCDKNEFYFVDSELFYDDGTILLPELNPRLYDGSNNLNSSGNKFEIQEKEREVNIQNI